MEIKLYLKGEISSISVWFAIIFFSPFLAIILLSRFSIIVNNIFILLILFLIFIIALWFDFKKKKTPYYIVYKNGFFQKGLFITCDGGKKVKCGRKFYWKNVDTVTTGYVSSETFVPNIMLIFKNGKKLYLPMKDFQVEKNLEKVDMSSDSVLDIFQQAFKHSQSKN